MSACFWRDLTSELGVLGSIHFLPTGAPFLPRVIEEFFQSSTSVVFEADLDKELDLTLLDLGPKRSLTDVLEPTLAAASLKAASDCGLDYERFRCGNPSALAFAIETCIFRAAAALPEQGLDRCLLTRARDAGKTVHFLEDCNYLFRVLRRSPETQLEHLTHVLRELDYGPARPQEMIAAWTAGDLQTIASIVENQYREFPKCRRMFLDQRNKNWLDQIKKYRRSSSPVLIVVGVAHLVGEGNLLHLLEHAGAKFDQA